MVDTNEPADDLRETEPEEASESPWNWEEGVEHKGSVFRRLQEANRWNVEHDYKGARRAMRMTMSERQVLAYIHGAAIQGTFSSLSDEERRFIKDGYWDENPAQVPAPIVEEVRLTGMTEEEWNLELEGAGPLKQAILAAGGGAGYDSDARQLVITFETRMLDEARSVFFEACRLRGWEIESHSVEE